MLLAESADAFESSPEGLVVLLKSGRKLSTQLVVLGVGVRPENKLAVDAGLEVGPRGGIRVNEFLQTSDPDIYAVGDAIERRVTGLRGDRLDRDQLDERARALLNMAGRDEIVVPYPQDRRLY